MIFADGLVFMFDFLYLFWGGGHQRPVRPLHFSCFDVALEFCIEILVESTLS